MKEIPAGLFATTNPSCGLAVAVPPMPIERTLDPIGNIPLRASSAPKTMHIEKKMSRLF